MASINFLFDGFYKVYLFLAQWMMQFRRGSGAKLELKTFPPLESLRSTVNRKQSET